MSGEVQINAETSPIPLIKINIDTNSENIMSKLNCAEILRWRHLIGTVSKWPYLIMEIWRIFFYLK